MDLSLELKNITDKLKEYLTNVKTLENMSPFNNEIIQTLEAKIESFEKAVKTVLQKLAQNKTINEKDFNDILKRYKKALNEIDKKLEKDLSLSDTTTKDSIKSINETIKKAKEEYQESKKASAVDVASYIASSEQNIAMFQFENKESLSRFNYQIQVAKKNYDDNIADFNNSLESEIANCQNNHGKEISLAINNFTELKKKYDEIIKKEKDIIQSKNEKYNVELVNLREEKRKYSIQLNEKIKKLTQEREDEIKKYKDNYQTQTQNNDNMKNDSIKNYQSESQAINKTYVSNINEIDDKIHQLTDAFETTNKTMTETKLYSIFLIHQKQEAELKDAYQNKNKRYAQKINKSYSKIKSNEAYKTDRYLSELKAEMENNINEERFKKKIFDIDRSSDFERLDETQIKINKYWQEKDNEFENALNYHTNVEISKYNKNANNARLEASSSNLSIESKIDELTAKYEKEIEKINNIIKKYELEIEVSTNLKDETIAYLTDYNNRKISFATVKNLLTAEKNKALYELNYKQYTSNVDNANLVLNYSIDKINIQNNKYKDSKNQELKIEGKKLENLEFQTKFRIDEINFENDKQKYLLNQNASYTRNYLSAKLFQDRFNLEIKALNQTLSTFITILFEAKNLILKSLNYLFKEIDFLAENHEMIKSISKVYNNAYYDYYSTLFKFYVDTRKQIIEKRKEFENNFKYSKILDKLNQMLEQELNAYRDEKDSLKKKIDVLVNSNEENRMKIYNLRYDENLSKKDKKLKEEDYQLEIKKNTSLIVDYNSRIDYLSGEEYKVEEKYSKRISQSKQIQNESFNAYKEFSKSSNELYNKIISIIKARFKIDYTINESYSSFLVKENEKETDEDLVRLNYQLFNKFFINYTDTINLSFESINQENKIEVESIERSFKNYLDKSKETYNNTNKDQIKDIENEELNLELMKKKYDLMIKEKDDNLKIEAKKILDKKNENINNFYIDLYAVSDNLDDIIKDYNENNTLKLIEFEEKKKQIIKDAAIKKKQYDDALILYIENRNEIIKHLPQGERLTKRSYQEDNKEKNLMLDLELEEERKKFILKKKQINQNLILLESAYKVKVNKINLNAKKQKIKERKAQEA